MSFTKTFWINTDERKLVKGFQKNQQENSLEFIQGDTLPCKIILLKSTGLQGRPFDNIETSTESLKIALGRVDKAPVSGTFKLDFDGDTTTDLNYNASATDIQTALSALTSIISAGGVTVTGNAGGPWTVEFTNIGNRNYITGDLNALNPYSQLNNIRKQDGDGSTKEIQVLKITEQPLALQNVFSAIPAPTASVDVRVEGTGSRNELQRIEIDSECIGGSIAVSFGGQTTSFNYGASEQDVQTALQSMSSIGTDNISVTKISDLIYDVYFVGSLGLADQAAMTVDASGLQGFSGFQGDLSLNTYAIEAFLDSADSGTCIFEIEMTSGSQKSTLFRKQVTVSNDIINEAATTPPLSATITFVESINGNSGVVTLDPDDLDDTSTAHKFASQAQLDKVDYLTVTGATDIDAMRTKVNALDENIASQVEAENKSSTDLTKRMPPQRVHQAIQQHINDLIDSSPAALDTLNELAAALGDDANFSTTMTNALAGKHSNTADLDLSDTYLLKGLLGLGFKDSTTLTIATGAVTQTQLVHKIENESAAAADDLTTVTPATDQKILIMTMGNAAQVPTIKHGTGTNQFLLPDDTDIEMKMNTFYMFLLDGTSWKLTGSAASGGGGAVDSVNGNTGVVVLDPDDLDDTSTTHKFATAAQLTKVDNLDDTVASQVEAENKSSTDLTKRMPPQRVHQAIQQHINDLIDSSPAALDTLNELAAALGDDANFSTTMTNALAGKAATTTTVTGTDGLEGGGSLAANRTINIADDGVTNAKLSNMANSTIKGRSTAGTGDPEDLTAAQVRTILNVEDGATGDQSDSQIETAYNNQVSIVSQAEAEAGTATTVRRWTAQRVAQAIAALGGGASFPPSTNNDKTGNHTVVAGDINEKVTLASGTTADSDFTLDVNLLSAGEFITFYNDSDYRLKIVVSNTSTMTIGEETEIYLWKGESISLSYISSTKAYVL